MVFSGVPLAKDLGEVLSQSHFDALYYMVRAF